jgi:hypothetical protein
MITAEQACGLCLTMPLVEEGSHRGQRDFRVKNKMFAAVLPGMYFMNLRVGQEEQFMLSSQTKMFTIPEVGGKGGWVSVRLAAIGEEDFLALVWKAWRHTAPPRLSLQY